MSELTSRRASGHFSSMGLWGELTEGDTLSCVHCQAIWVCKKGSGKIRGYCERCHGYFCGPGCQACVPWERQLDNIEAGRPQLTPMPTSIIVPPGIEDLSPGG